MAGTPAKSEGRPARAAHRKKALPPGFVDSGTITLQGDENESQMATPPVAQDSPLLLKYAPQSAALQRLEDLLGVSHSSSVSDSRKRKRPIKETLIVTLPLPHGTIDKNASYNPTRKGFMDLPIELREKVYRDVFIKDVQTRITGRAQHTYPHSSALLRANKAIYHESRKYLYSENRFLFVPSTLITVTPYDQGWAELSYSHARQFLEDIGPENTGMLKNIGISFEDRSPSGNPGLTMDELRFESNKDVIWILEYLARYGLRIEKLKLGFTGRRRMVARGWDTNVVEFLLALSRVKTDKLLFGDPAVFDDQETYLWYNPTPIDPNE